MWQLADKYDHIEGCGVIGITKYKPNKIVRRPSAIYWNGLNFFGFVSSGGLALDAFLKQSTSSNISDLLSLSVEGDDASKDDMDAGFQNVFKVKVPVKKDWQNDLDLVLSKEEAEIFHDKILTGGKGLLISKVLQD